jgi:hypothetical protein
MRKTGLRVAIVLLIFLAAVALAASQSGVADKRQVTFYDPVRIGETLLPAGEYTVLHQMQGTNHIMVFTQMGKKKAAEAKVKCTLVPLDKPAATSELGFKTNAANERLLTRMVFKGDRAAHHF